MTTASLNGIELATAAPDALVLSIARDLVGGRRNAFVEIPGRAGSWPIREEPGDRFVRISVDLLSDTFAERRATVRDLADWAETPSGPVRLIADDEPDRFHAVTLEGFSEMNEWLTHGAGELSYRAGPYALALDLSTELHSVTTPSPKSGSFTAPDKIVAEPVIEITPTGGTLTALTVTLNDDSISWAGLVNSGDTLTVSSISATITLGANTDVNLTGAYNAANVDLADASGTFGLVVPGSNTYEYAWTGTATGLTISITWRRRYR